MVDNATINVAAPAEWLAARKNYIGGSDIAAILGVHPYKSAMDVWADKLNQAPPFEGNLRTRLGHQLEAFVADEFVAATGLDVRESGSWLTDPQVKYFGGRVDRIVPPANVVEIKTVGAHASHRWEDGPPDEVVCQLQWYLMLTGGNTGYAVALHLGEGRLQIHEMGADADLIAEMREVGERFWAEHILTGIPPAPDGSDATATLIRSLLPTSRDELVIEATPELTDVVRDLESVTQQARAAYKRKAELEQRIQLAMGEAAVMVVPGYEKPITWKRTRDTVGVDYKAAFETAVARGLLDPETADALAREATTVLRQGGRMFLTPWSRQRAE